MNVIASIVCFYAAAFPQEGPWFANGIKVGEATQTTAIVWVRLTARPDADFSLLPILAEGLPSNGKSDVAMPVDVLPGMAGQVRLSYWIDDDVSARKVTEWAQVVSDTDFTFQFRLSQLKSGSRYRVHLAARRSPSDKTLETIEGTFRTAPRTEDSAPVRFIVTTCQAIRSIDSGKNGHIAYKQMLGYRPDFFVHTGDIVYYDKAPFAKSLAQARAKWNVMFAYGYQRNFHRSVGSYFMKDDHDTLKNDCWPGQRYGDLSFQQGLDVFREQVCMGEKTWRTIRWGRDVQIWMTENRDFRSPNREDDGPHKTILGKMQKEWLFSTVSASNATFKFVISPGPIVGPDKKGKKDNHANAAFATEGRELREFIASQENTYIICGDRHWQYCSQDPETAILELGCGPINDQHDFGGDPGMDEKTHRYFSAKGGFLVLSVDGKQAVAEWVNSNSVDPETGQPVVLHTETFQKQ